MYATSVGLGREALLDSLADWSGPDLQGRDAQDDAAAPEGHGAQHRHHPVELGDKFAYAHDEVATDKRNPTLNADGKVWASTSATTGSSR